MQNFTMTVSKKENGEYKEVGKVAVFYPLLSELGLAVEPKGNDEEGFPQYDNDKVQYVFDSVLAQVKAQARNKLVSGTATLKDGQKIAETVEELLASGGGNRGEALATLREMLGKFKAYLATSGKNAKVQEIVYTFAAKREALVLATAERKEKFLAILTAFVETLSAEDVAKYQRPLMALNEAAQTEEMEDF